MKPIKYIIPALAVALAGMAAASCDDMLDMGNDDMLYADRNHLTQATDTVNSFVGILAQLQKIAVRTNLYGELRADLSVVNPTADADLKAIASFQVADDNAYNNPRDYYAVVNNCNYFLANADTTLHETTLNGGSRTEFYVFRAEYTAVRAIRAWIYLQLGQVYGTNVPVVTRPILSLEDADEALASAPKMDLGQICDYFIDDLLPYVSWFDYPYHGNPGYAGYNGEMPSRMAVLPIQLVLGDLYLWSASIRRDPQLARLAAKSYYDYINWVPTFGGVENNSSYKVKTTTGATACQWPITGATFSGSTTVNGIPSWFDTSSFGGNSSEVIAAIGMDSASSEGYFNELRYLYSYSFDDENVEASISPSQPCYDISDAQTYFAIYARAGSSLQLDSQYVTREMLPQTMQERHYSGDLRLPSAIGMTTRGDHDYQSQIIYKHYKDNTGLFNSQDIIIYRRGDVYLRLAEALNYAGFPKFALSILTTGLDENVVGALVMPQCTTAADSAFVSYFQFPRAYYRTRVTGITYSGGIPVPQVNYTVTDYNQIGLHERGAGSVADNRTYYDPVAVERPDNLESAPQPLPALRAAYAVNAPGQTIMDSLYSQNPELMAFVESLAAETPTLVIPTLETSGSPENFLLDARDFVETLAVLSDYAYTLWQEAYAAWYRDNAAPQVKARMTSVADSLIDIESALETPFEGFRFGYLMRAAYRRNEPAYLARKVAAREPSLLGLLSDPSNWFVSWHGPGGASIGK